MSTYWENYLADKRYTCFKEKSVDVDVVVVPEFACWAQKVNSYIAAPKFSKFSSKFCFSRWSIEYQRRVRWNDFVDEVDKLSKLPVSFSAQFSAKSWKKEFFLLVHFCLQKKLGRKKWESVGCSCPGPSSSSSGTSPKKFGPGNISNPRSGVTVIIRTVITSIGTRAEVRAGACETRPDVTNENTISLIRYDLILGLLEPRIQWQLLDFFLLPYLALTLVRR